MQRRTNPTHYPQRSNDNNADSESKYTKKATATITTRRTGRSNAQNNKDNNHGTGSPSIIIAYTCSFLCLGFIVTIIMGSQFHAQPAGSSRNTAAVWVNNNNNNSIQAAADVSTSPLLRANNNDNTNNNKNNKMEDPMKSVKLSGANHHVALPDVLGKMGQTSKATGEEATHTSKQSNNNTNTNNEATNANAINLYPLAGDVQYTKRLPDQISRGAIGLPMTQTPALKSAKPGHIQCKVDASSLAYWNDPRGAFDVQFTTPFEHNPSQEETNTKSNTKPQYVTFEPDSGGWNNIRMSMEIIFVFAAATGRTLVLPPDQPLYLLTVDSSKKHRGFGDFFALDNPAFRDTLEVISTEEFLKREGGPDGQFPIPDDETRASLSNIQSHCERRAKSNIACGPLWSFYENESKAYIPEINDRDSCVIFGPRSQEEADVSPHSEKILEFCRLQKKPVYYHKKMSSAQLIHFKTEQKGHRLVQHFYNTILFTDPMIDNYFKRFVRDFLHYRDPIFCAAAKIIEAIQQEAAELGFHPDEDGAGGYSALHVRRGDLQYKRVKIPAEEWRENTQDIWLDNEILYIATDERDKSFFEPLKYDADTGKEKRHELRYLDDYWDIANLGDMDPNYFGMLDTIVASRGRAFAGTYYSTFTGYINRMRGYHGMSMKDSYYGYKPQYDAMHSWDRQWGTGAMSWAIEFPTGWVGIDGDVMGTADGFAY